MEGVRAKDSTPKDTRGLFELRSTATCALYPVICGIVIIVASPHPTRSLRFRHSPQLDRVHRSYCPSSGAVNCE